MNTYLLDSIATCLENGYRQKNFTEMIDFFRYATFFSFREEFQPVLASRSALRSVFECVRQLGSDHDV